MATINEVLTLTDNMTPKLTTISSAFASTSASFNSFKSSSMQNMSTVSSSFAGASTSSTNFGNTVAKDMAKVSSSIVNETSKIASSTNTIFSKTSSSFSSFFTKLKQSASSLLPSIDGIKNSIGGIKQPISNIPSDPMKPIKDSSDKAKVSVIGLSAAITLMNKAFSLITSYVGNAFTRADTIDQFSKTVTLLTGNVDIANTLMEQLSATMKGTPYALDAAASGMQRLITSGRDLGLVTTDTERWADAVAVYAGGSTEALSSVMDANAKMLTRGKVNLEQLNRMMEAGIPVIDLYAKTTGKSAEIISKAISDGKISAVDFMDTMNTAFSSFEGSAKNAGSTWKGTFANFGSAMSRGLLNIIDGFDNAIQSAGLPSIKEMVGSMGKSIEKMMSGIGGIFAKLQPVFKLVQGIFLIVSGVWKKIGPPILQGIDMLITGVSSLASLIVSNLDIIIPALTVVALVLLPGMITSLWSMIAPVLLQAAAWLAVNWPILLVAAAIIGILALLQKMGVTSQQILGTIGAGFGWLTAMIWNGTVVPLYNLFATFAEFLANVFDDPIGSIVRAFASMADIVLGIIENIAGAIDKILPDSDMAGAIAGFREDLTQKVKDNFGEPEIQFDRLTEMDVNQAMQMGGDIGLNIANGLDGLSDTLSNGMGGLSDTMSGGMGSLSDLADTGVNVSGGDLDSVGKIKSDVTIDSEELKMMTDMAQDKFIADRNIYVTNNTSANFGDVHETADVNQILSVLEENVVSSYETNLVGVG